MSKQFNIWLTLYILRLSFSICEEKVLQECTFSLTTFILNLSSFLLLVKNQFTSSFCVLAFLFISFYLKSPPFQFLALICFNSHPSIFLELFLAARYQMSLAVTLSYSASLSLCLSVSLSFCLPVSLSPCLTVSPCPTLFLYLSVFLSPCLSLHFVKETQQRKIKKFTSKYDTKTPDPKHPLANLNYKQTNDW